MSWHEFGQTALRPRDDTKISYTDAVARAREKSFGKILLRLERERGTSFYFATSVFLFGWTTRSANDRCTRRKYKNGNVETLNVCIIVVATSELSRPMKYEFVIGNTLKAIVEFVIHEMVCAPLSCLPRYSFGLNYTLVSRCVFIETWHIEIGGVEMKLRRLINEYVRCIIERGIFSNARVHVCVYVLTRRIMSQRINKKKKERIKKLNGKWVIIHRVK